jgi:hypothetical protein
MIDLKDIKGLEDLMKLGTTLEQITESLRDQLPEEDRKKFDDELDKNGYEKTLQEAKSLKSQLKGFE